MAAKRRPAIVLHGPGEFTERALEAAGIFLNDQPVDAMNEQENRDLALRAVRELSRRLVNIFTEALAPAIPIDPATQGVLHLSSDGELITRRGAWLERLARTPAIPVLSPTAASVAGDVLVPERRILAGVTGDGSEVVPVVFTKTSLPGIMKGRETIQAVDAAESDLHEHVRDPEVLEILMLARRGFLLTNASGLGSAAEPVGTMVSFNS